MADMETTSAETTSAETTTENKQIIIDTYDSFIENYCFNSKNLKNIKYTGPTTDLTEGIFYQTGCNGYKLNIDTAIKYLTRAANNGCMYSMNNLSCIYINKEKYKNVPLAIEWINKAIGLINSATHQNVVCVANSNLAYIYTHEKEYKNIPLAIEILSKISESGDRYADFELGSIYAR
jgi:TPR repeat protein